MKKIIDKIKANKNLYKGLKIFKLVLDCLVYGFAIFMLIGLAIGSTYKPKESQALDRQLIPNVATTPIKKVIEDRYAVFYGFGDFMSPAFAEITYANLTSSEINQIGLTGKTYENFLAGEEISIDTTDMLYGIMNSAGDYISWSSLNIGYMYIQKDNTYNYPVYSIRFAVTQGTNYYENRFNYGRYSIYNNDGELTYFNWSTAAVFRKSSDNGATWTTNQMNSNDFATYYAIPKTYNFNWIGTDQNKYNTYYNNGYNDGYSTGKQAGQETGYQDGYGVGYYDGLQAAEDGETTMFSLITRAFNAIASILDIQILPNLSLGLLIFTPIIVSIIILIIKMVKG